MRLQVFAVILICAAGPSIAFPLGVWVASGGGWRDKSGPKAPERDGAGRVIAQRNPVRVILPGTLDGQSIPGKGNESPQHGRELSPVYPTSPSVDMDRSVSQGLAPAAQASEAQAGEASLLPVYVPLSLEASPGQRPLNHHIPRHQKRLGATAFVEWPRRRRVAIHRPDRYFVAQTVRPANPITLLTRLLFH
jgi:hypothetical protein